MVKGKYYSLIQISKNLDYILCRLIISNLYTHLIITSKNNINHIIVFDKYISCDNI